MKTVAIGILLIGLLSSISTQLILKKHAPLPKQQHPLYKVAQQTGGIHSFADVVQATCGHDIKRFDLENPIHAELQTLILSFGTDISQEMSQPTAPVRKNRRINEASKYFEDAIRARFQGDRRFSCSIPKTREGKEQRSGYPDLRIEHLASGSVFYLDPKLFEESSKKSSFRTFYFEPGKNHKITEDAVHLLMGFPHDGLTQRWIFGIPTLVDLHQLKVKLKTEFSASNRDLYKQN